MQNPEGIHLSPPWRWAELKSLFRYAPGLLLMIWTLLPILLQDINTYFKIEVLPDDTACLYVLFTPFVWVIIGAWGSYHTQPTVSLGLIGHIALFIAVVRFINSSNLSFFYDWDILFRLGLLILIIFAAAGSTIVVLITGWFIRRDAAQAVSRIKS